MSTDNCKDKKNGSRRAEKKKEIERESQIKPDGWSTDPDGWST